MADGASAPAPATPTTPGAPTGTAPAGTEKTAGAQALAASKTDAPKAWGDDDDKAFFELAKRSPYRAKMRGEEKAIDSKETLRDLLNHAQRGMGASKVVEEAKKEAEAAKKEREAVAHEKELIARAKKGDFEARKALGLASNEEIRARDDEWAKVPPEVRELYDDRNKAHEELTKLRAEKEQAAREQTERQQAAELAAAKRVATNATHEVLKALNVSEAQAERMLPHVAGAIGDLGDAGLELGVDMTPELIIERVKQRLGAFDEEHFSGLDPSRAIALIAPKLMGADDATLDKYVPEALQRRIATRVARAMRGTKAVEKQGGAAPMPKGDAPKNGRAPQILDFAHFRR